MGIERLNEFWPEWSVVGVLGTGAFGKVYKAVDNEAGFASYSAIKVISIPASDADTDALLSEGMTEKETETYFKGIVNDFVNEIKLMSNLKGAPNIVIVDTYKILEKKDTIGWDIFIRMELLNSFKDYLKNHVPEEKEVIKLGIDIANALEICQSRNIIHRDIKPANIFIDGFGNFKLGDFGIAKELEKTTGAVSAKGTFSYMAPEVARGQRYDNTVDIYSLGLVMYSLLNNNRPPFIDPYKMDVSYNERKDANDRRLAGEPLPAPCNASSNLADVILTACSYDPSKRFKSATAFKNALLSCINSVKVPINIPETAKVTEAQQNIDETVAVRDFKNTEETDDSYDDSYEFNDEGYEESENQLDDSYQDDNEGYDKETKNAVRLILIIFVVIVIILMIIAGITSFEYSKNDVSDEVVNDSSSYPEISSTSDVGDTVTFGHYEQDNDSSNGKEEIEWIVLARDRDKALVTSKYALDCLLYNAGYERVTWENCTLREWLNNEFYNTAFNEEEKAQIETSYIVNDDNEYYGTEGGNNTYDKVFLLSIDEAESYFSSDGAMCCKPTEYAVARGTYKSVSNDENCWWWLRSPGKTDYDAASVYPGGGVYNYGNDVNYSYSALRPALWIDLES